MGTCMGRCFSVHNSKRPYHSQRSLYSTEKDNVEFDFLVDDVKAPEQERTCFQGISSLFSLRRKKSTQEVVLELTDDTWMKSDRAVASISTQKTGDGCDADVQLQPLDARSLLAARALHQAAPSMMRERSITSSTPPSSLDLEWEHEDFLLRSSVPIEPLPEEDRCDSSATNDQNGISSAGWSRISSPDSLEWDPVEAPLASAADRHGELDAETEQLLSEIERLTSRALRETGDWSS